MVNSTIKLLAIDIDGTLLDPSGKMDKEVTETLKNLSEKDDTIISIVTSRPMDDALMVFRENGVNNSNFPSLILAEEREIYISKDGHYLPLSPEWNDWIISEEEMLLPQTRKLLKKWAEKFRKRGFQFSCVSPEVEKRRKYTSLVFSDIDQAEEARQYIEKQLSSLNLPLRVERPAFCLDLRSNRTGKGKTLKKAIETLGISSKRVLCIGDSHNDLEMLDGRYGFQSACPNNAEEIIKRAVLNNNGYIARWKYGKGVAEIIENLFLENRR